MKTITLISEFGNAQAILIDRELPIATFITLDGLFHGRSFNQPDLAKRWGCHQVIAVGTWAAQQRKRTPMLKPKGVRMAILDET